MHSYVLANLCPVTLSYWKNAVLTHSKGYWTLRHTTLHMATPTIHVFQQLKQNSSRLCKSECDACSTLLPHCLICVAPHWQGKTLAEGWQHFMWHVRTEHDQGATVLSVQTGQSMYRNLNRNILERGPNKTETHNHALHNFQRRWQMYQDVMGTKACNMHA